MWATLHAGMDVHAGKLLFAQEQIRLQKHVYIVQSKRPTQLQGPLFMLYKQLALHAVLRLWSPTCFPRPAQTAVDPWEAAQQAETRMPPQGAPQLEIPLHENPAFSLEFWGTVLACFCFFLTSLATQSKAILGSVWRFFLKCFPNGRHCLR